MKSLHTPDERFDRLEGWPYEPKYVTVDGGLRMSYVDEGPRSAPSVLLAHGEPTWGYLYRNMIPALLAAGHRVIVPDLVGFGRSDKPVDHADYTYGRHVEWAGALLEQLDVTDVVLFAHDWGGLIFLVHVARTPERFRAVIAANTGLPDPELDLGSLGAETLAPFLAWYEYSQTRDPFLASESVGGDSPLNQTGHRLTALEREGYDAPFPDESYQAGARQLPLLVPLGNDDPANPMLREAWNGLERFDKPFVTVFAEHENITRVFEPLMQQRIPGARGQKHITVPNSGHFLQEHQPELLVDVILQLDSSRMNASASQR